MLNRHETIPNAYVYNPIVELTTDDVWKVLLEHNSGKTPWGSDNSELVALYSDADSGECPFAGMANSAQTQSCGGSRFGCIVRPQMIQFQESKIPSISAYFEICRS